MPTAEFHFDFASPNTYLSYLLFPEIEKRTGVKFTWVPVLLGGLFKATNNVPPMVAMEGILNKGEYQRLEMRRFIAKHKISSFKSNPHFPVNTLTLMRGAVHAQHTDYFERYVDEVYRHIWSEPKKMDDPEVIHAALLESGLPADEILQATQDPAVKKELIANTQSSVERGNFGAPTFFVGEEMFFGKDRLQDVEEEIIKQS